MGLQTGLGLRWAWWSLLAWHWRTCIQFSQKLFCVPWLCSCPSLALVNFNPFPRPRVGLTLGRPGVQGHLSVYLGVSLCLSY